mmetsp:Transcript_5800/g.17759  ORF Transcript_5800/g.17759 Transcript_5800/m.17759 type:complete len:92 (-) Transcript_5800:23-298(-)
MAPTPETTREEESVQACPVDEHEKDEKVKVEEEALLGEVHFLFTALVPCVLSRSLSVSYCSLVVLALFSMCSLARSLFLSVDCIARELVYS